LKRQRHQLRSNQLATLAARHAVPTIS